MRNSDSAPDDKIIEQVSTIFNKALGVIVAGVILAAIIWCIIQ